MRVAIAVRLLLGFAGLVFLPASGAWAEGTTPVVTLCQEAGVPAGLCVFAGWGDSRLSAELAATGRYLVHVLEAEQATVVAQREKFQAAGIYGLVSAEMLSTDGKLPYTENLVNAIFAGSACAGQISAAELFRVLCPGGVLLTDDKRPDSRTFTAAGFEQAPPVGSGWRCLRKPWPKALDQWTHPRHAADGNAVSLDEVVGPPRRVRWVTGPQQEVSNMVTAGGRCFIGGVLARDAFNGLRLWQQSLTPSPARGGFNFKSPSGSVRPVATAQGLLVVNDSRLQLLDAATGKQLREYPAADVPTEILVRDETIVTIDQESVRALDLSSGQLRWKQDAICARCVVAGDDAVLYVQAEQKPAKGWPPANAPVRLLCRDRATGKLRWEHQDFAWLPKIRGCMVHGSIVVCEISTLADEKLGNSIQVLSLRDGSLLWSREYVPGSQHMKQARAMFVGELLWVLEDKRTVGLDPRTGEVRKTHPAGRTHCFPPVASTRYLFAGELDLTDFTTGVIDANQITKTACSRDAGVVPANGLLYTFPKHCICWPMLRDYAALAPARPGGMPRLADLSFAPQPGPAVAPQTEAEDPRSQWPCYRHDALRSGSSLGAAPQNLAVRWTAKFGALPEGVIAQDWRSNYFIRGPLGPPVAAAGLVYVTRPDAHQVVAVDAQTGGIRWTFTANGRVDTAPTIHRGMCLFGCKSGWVYGLRADNGALVWRLRAAPLDERIVAYGQLESPWPVPGSVLVIDDVAYFAAGRQPLADGGILVFAVEPRSGRVRWTQRLDHVPQTNFYGSSGLEFDNFDLLQREGDAVAMSRWLFDRATGQMACREKSGFAQLATGAAAVMFPRGSWSYAPRNETEQWKERPYLRPLAVFRDNTLFCGSQDRQTLFRRDFHLDAGEKFDADWFAGWSTYERARKGGELWRTQRLAHGVAWSVTPAASADEKQSITAMILAGDALYVAGEHGRLVVLDAKTGSTLSTLQTPPPAWDALAAADGQLFLSTADGQLVCFGAK